MNEPEYIDMVESSQLSLQDFFVKYHRSIPEEMKYSTKVGLNITVDDNVYSYQKVKLKVGGNNSRTYAKLGFNLKLSKQTFFGRNNLRLRSDYTDISHIRSKLAVDLINKWNIPTVQVTYANLYINNKYFGFYMLLDAIKPNWIRDIYNLPEEQEVKTLYSCSAQTLAFNPDVVKSVCQNEKEEYLNYTKPLHDMIDEVIFPTKFRDKKKSLIMQK
ncbi:hypothetical protein PIROE2DRAFT_61334 [Piromyces sp. E2]|nr:hypothetical protein PIROE2DRAFT_61334 [Piromyces sp. E2]|eukprot:OUM63352.1 hypothetical protein PIROE2DRAFT_61334 [Piromyces sp. E2]